MKIKGNLLCSLAAAAFMACVQSHAYAQGDNTVTAAKPDAEAAETAQPSEKEQVDNKVPAPVVTNVAGAYLAGQFAKNSGHLDSAIRSLQDVYDEDPSNLSVAAQLQGMLLMQGRIDEVVKLSEAIRAGGMKDQISALVLSLRNIKNDDMDAASAVLTSAQDGNSTQLWLPLIAGWVDVGRHKLDKPLTIESVTANAGRAAPLVNYHLALINSQAGFREEAARNFKAAIEDPEDPPKRVMKQLLKFYDQSESPEVLTPLVNSYRQSHPDNVDKDPVPVIASVREGVAEVMYTMGGIMFGAGVANDAAIYLQMAVYVKPDLSEALVALGDAYGDLQQYARSNEMYGRIALHNPYYVNAQIHIAVNYERMGKLNESLALLDKLAKQSGGDMETLVTRGDLLRIHGRFAEAADAYSKALVHVKEPKATSWPILFARGTCYERMGKWPQAEKDMLQALELKPDQPDVLNYLGFGWLERGVNVSEAMAMIKKAIKARPDDAQIVDSMGWALYIQGDYKGAMEYLERAVELLPGDPAVNDHLGDLYWRLGRKTEARFQWERSLTFSPEDKLSDSIHRKLKDGLPPASAQAAGTLTSDAADKSAAHATP